MKKSQKKEISGMDKAASKSDERDPTGAWKIECRLGWFWGLQVVLTIVVQEYTRRIWGGGAKGALPPFAFSSSLKKWENSPGYIWHELGCFFYASLYK